MPELSAETKHYHRERIRSLIVQNPQTSPEGIRRHLEAQGLSITRKYIAKHVKAIMVERAKRADTWMLNHALASFQDAMSEIVRIAMEVATDPRQPGRDRAAALREAREAYNLSFEKLFDAGVFERKLGTLETTIRNTPLDDDRKQAIRSVFENWGLIAPEEKLSPLAETLTFPYTPPKEDDGTDQSAVAP